MGYIYTKSGKLAKRLYFGAVLLFEGLYYTFKNRVLADGGTFVENELPTISQDASLVLTPNAYKAGKLYSAVPNDGTGDFTVDRNSTATYVGKDGLIKTAQPNVPRFDWSSGEAALLTEPQRTNLVAYSEDFTTTIYSDGASWNDVLDNQAISPIGILDASKYTLNQSGFTYALTASSNVISGVPYTSSVYLKYLDSRYIQLWFGSTGFNGGDVVFDLINSTFENHSGCIGNMIDIGNGWYRCSITKTTIEASSNTGIFAITSVTSLNSTRFDNTVIGSVYFWGAQLEQASKASSYIPTNGTTVTRLADEISVPTPAGVTSITETIDGVEQTPITTIPTTYSLPVGNINKVTML